MSRRGENCGPYAGAVWPAGAESPAIGGGPRSLFGGGTLGQLTLWSGRSLVVPAVLANMLAEAWPERTAFRWCVGDEVRPAEAGLLEGAAAELRSRGHYVEMWRRPGAPAVRPEVKERHDHVAELYAEAFARCREDYLLTIEDDCVPPVGGLARLAESMSLDVAAVAGVYRIRGIEERLNCSVSLSEMWTAPLAEDFPAAVVETPMVGGGFTLWRGLALAQVPPVQCLMFRDAEGRDTWLAGWDDWIGRHLARRGWRVLSDGRLWVRHENEQVRKFLEERGLEA